MTESTVERELQKRRRQNAHQPLGSVQAMGGMRSRGVGGWVEWKCVGRWMRVVEIWESIATDCW